MENNAIFLMALFGIITQRTDAIAIDLFKNRHSNVCHSAWIQFSHKLELTIEYSKFTLRMH